MRTFLGIFILLAILASSLQSAANSRSIATLAHDDFISTVSEQPDDPSIGQPSEDTVQDDDCAGCQTSCFCACHSGLLPTDWAHLEPLLPESAAPAINERYASLTVPPFLPPPIAPLTT
ncbi:MAG: hypothetical protein WD078_06875 [Woeseia sp.]